MFKNYIITTFRSFIRNKSSFFINVTGLSIGVACSILIMLWLLDELNYDRFHADSDRIYQVMEHQSYSDNIMTVSSTPGVLSPALKEEFPEVEYAATYLWNMEFLFTKGEKSLKENGLYARPDFFHILDIKLLHGNRDALINSPKTVTISRELAMKYFGKENVVGESITINGTQLHTITGVFEKLPRNSSIQFDCVFPYKDWLEQNEWANHWENNGPRTIAKLYPNVDVDALNDRINDLIKQKTGDSNASLFVYPFADLYLYGQFENGKVVGGRIDYVRLFSVVAVFILLIACINFMNLSTAKATKRAREVGIRKSIGASKRSLIGQFIGESMMITLFSLLISVILVELSLPIFNNLTDKDIYLNYQDPTLLIIFLGIALVTGLIAGSYPAFYLSSFEAVKTLKGTIRTSGGEGFVRKGLVVFQFTLSVILIISTVVVYKQIQYTQTKKLGYQKENLITFSVEGDVQENWNTFKDQLLSLPSVMNVSRSNSSFLRQHSNTEDVQWLGKDPKTLILFEDISTDYEFIETMGIELLEGRTHSRKFGDETTRILINQAAANVMGFKNPIGEFVTIDGNEKEIIGLVKDFNFRNLHYRVEPLFIRLAPQSALRAYVRIHSDNIRNTLGEIEHVYKRFNVDYPFDYDFMDERYAALYRSEQRIGDLAKYFSIFAIIISCLGLFGLSAFTAEQRSKEIGVRKVLGASVQNLVVLLTKDFSKLVLFAICIAIPISWWLMNRWLSNYAYQFGLEWWIFALSGILAIVIAWLTVSWQSIQAALANPVESLRSE